MGSNGLLCSSKRAVSLFGSRYSVALSIMAPVLRLNWIYLPRDGYVSAVAIVGVVSTIMLGEVLKVKCF